jgi:general secretion pathway protein C
VVANRSQKGAALIAVDGKPPKPYRVGAPVDEGIVLQSVESRRAVLAGPDGAPVLTLDLPPLRK